MGPTAVDTVAWHLAAAVQGPDEEVARLLEESATAALGRRGYASAAIALAAAARLSPADPDRVRRTIGAAGAFRLGGEAQQAADILAEALHLASDPLVRADMQQLRAAALMYVSPMMDTFALLVDEADRVEPHDPARAAVLLAVATNAGGAAAEIDLVVETGRRAVRLSRAVGGPVKMLAALALGNGLILAGRIDEARAIFEPLVPALETIDPLGEAGAVLVTTPAAFTWIGDLVTARRMLDRVVSAARGASAAAMLPYPLAILSDLELRCGRLAPAYAAATESVRLAAETGQAGLSSFAVVTVARVEALRGLEEECTGHVAAALEGSRRLGAASIETYAASVLGLLELSLSRPERATAHLEECARLGVKHGLGLPDVVPWRADLIEAYARLGRAEDAELQLGTLEEEARATGSRWAMAVAARSRGLLANDDGYEVPMGLALALHGDREPFERARTELCLGRRRRHSRHRAAARDVLRQALATFDALGAEPWAEQARAELRGTGESPAPGRGRSLMALTPQELQVALVVAGGATNREAGAALFISPKTVEYHLGNVYSKLGVRSRTELVPKVAALA